MASLKASEQAVSVCLVMANSVCGTPTAIVFTRVAGDAGVISPSSAPYFIYADKDPWITQAEVIHLAFSGTCGCSINRGLLHRLFRGAELKAAENSPVCYQP